MSTLGVPGFAMLCQRTAKGSVAGLGVGCPDLRRLDIGYLSVGVGNKDMNAWNVSCGAASYILAKSKLRHGVVMAKSVTEALVSCTHAGAFRDHRPTASLQFVYS